MFTPQQTNQVQDVPFYDDATTKDGWQGQGTTKSIATLKSEIVQSVGRLGGTVTRFQRGVYEVGNRKRDGFQIFYVIESPSGELIPGRIDVASLPVRSNSRNSQSEGKRREQSLCMALYMLRMALDGSWFLQQLSPGYSALMPFMLASDNRTISQVWGESAMRNLLPPPNSDFIEGVVKIA